MSFVKGLLGAMFSDPETPNPNSSSSSSPSPTSTTRRRNNERVAYKLKGYYDLALEEIAKAVAADESGSIHDSVLHYTNANRILREGASTPKEIANENEDENCTSYRQKIAKWQSQVSARLHSLNTRTPPPPPLNIARRRPQAISLNPSYAANKAKPGHPATTSRTRAHRPTTGVEKPNQDGGGYDTKLVEMINTVIVDRSPSVKWDDVAGLEKAKQTLFEMVIWPTKRRDLFTGLRRPPRGLLLFGPPGNGKTLLAKAVASQSNATFFNVSASSLTSKWVGEGEKLVRTLFMVAISRQPSVIFMDEIDSIMSTRLASEHDASRRLKSEFLVQFDGVTSSSDDLVIVIGATNKPQELDDAVLRRLVKRIFIPLPDQNVRKLILKQKLKGQAFSIPGGDLERLAQETEGYSASDLQALCEEAAMIPIRELGSNILTVKADQVRPLRYVDFRKAMAVIRPSLQKSKWEELERWNEEFGSN